MTHIFKNEGILRARRRGAPGSLCPGLLCAGSCAGCCLVHHLEPSYNPRECHQPCATMRTRKAETKEFAQGHKAGKMGASGFRPRVGGKRQEAQLPVFQERNRCSRVDGAQEGQGDPGRGLRRVRPESTGSSVPWHMLFPLIHTSCSFYSNSSPFEPQLRGPHCRVAQPSNAACPPLNGP